MHKGPVVAAKILQQDFVGGDQNPSVLARDPLVEDLDVGARRPTQDYALVQNVDRMGVSPPDSFQNPVRLAEHP